MPSIPRLACALSSLLAMAVPALGQEADGPALAQSCTSCHGIEGRGGGTIPALAGRDEAELLARMKALKAPDAAGPDAMLVMPRLLRDYSDDEIKALAAYFAKVAP